ncbi:GTP cyclohydrolase I FolE2 [Desulfobotulus sp. H1]|uniref:GTP cyclohydrolase I FolE2 n=1 Tax=Desulfobotulus pelophilus TaxID=2823377 RepID=A0ABT3NBS0_9BACT|nr:GTP cyclohydrolase, FolE2/MptA family [Desulfobotulus pelophilus]MCW7754917.1 GTP cyclohydrolase I FolE2 [Desulfobotulus pelophilus]
MEKHSGLLYCCQRSGADGPMISDEDHTRVLATCTDIPEEAPDFRLPIDGVGIGNKTVWIKLPSGLTPFGADIRVNLPGRIKGIHMSRIEAVISELLEKEFADIGLYAAALAEGVLETQEGDRADVRIEGKLPILQKTPASRRISLDTLDVSARALVFSSAGHSTSRVTVSAGVHHITACPCTQAYNRVLFKTDTELPLITHSQRSFTRLSMERHGDVPRFSDLFDCLNAGLHVTSDLLKRTDEAEMVLKAHTTPQFAEDTTRETARQAGLRFGKILPASTLVSIRSDSLESIHTHDVIASIHTTMGDILSVLEENN